ncbi:MAG: sigma-70 family RNA polymerase sigma factor [Bacteroidaceae bacterium]|jgi:RNA polymerase sigma-70 factor (ECF subfamily)|nr:sigma-70 family RNA polymerase sigma factor [Bacteroidaceae bacterium]MBR3373767.1 sigma-70 family RNA polymerase sigma factor [Bacteroidaceae bacterium]MBR3633849.1 sigma-70 family RNA polymerase sigma factor [Bacteroidaceae bacterium]MBR3732974.1 sigma-70 family RNA polymerase sigma factor [Bacteroidaceae bacterium]MBR6713750.1 sigma-70 family RNA polymerase sigma factor [Bacteroidaceae bacterium]
MIKFQALTDDELVSLYAEGNNTAFDVLLSRYQSKLYSYIFYIVHDEEVANDLFQDTFLKVIMRIQDGSYTGYGKFQAWLTRIAHNLVMDYFRDKEQALTISNDEADYDLLNNARLAEHTTEDQMLVSQSLKDAKAIMDLLPEPQSEVVKMRFYDNMSFKEIAEKLNISINTALGRMRYAVINMRNIAQEKNIALYAE